MATIRKHRAKWQVQIRRKGHKHLTRSFRLKENAVTWAKQIEAEADRTGLPPDLRTLEKLSVADLLKRYRNGVVPLKRGSDIETIIIDAFLRTEIADTQLSQLNPSQFAAYRDERLKKVKPATINRELGILHHAFEVARKEWCIPLQANPLASVKRPRLANRRDRRLRTGEWDRLASAWTECRNPLIKSVVQFAVTTGMRRSEILRATWRDVNWTERTLHIPVAKNGHARTIPLSPAALGVVAAQGNIYAAEERLFPLSAEAVKLGWKRLAARAGIADLHFHDLRHEAVSRFFELGLSIPEVAVISGHRDPRMLFRYTHLLPSDLAKKLIHLGSARPDHGQA